jgi:hypothetical protein
MLPKAKLMENWINEYLAAAPDGLDVTAHVFNQIGPDDFSTYCGAKSLLGPARQKRIDEAKKAMGKEMKEKLQSMFHVVDTLTTVPTDPALWPELAKWVTSYTQHRVDTKRRKLW